MGDNRHHQIEGKPVWEKLDEESEPNREPCQRGNHTWIASFFQSGRLAYRACAGCGKMDRVNTRLPERLEVFNGWVKSPPRLIAQGPSPPASTRRWVTTEGALLSEGDPSSIHFVGLVIPGLAEAHTYVKCDENEKIVEVYEPCRERHSKYGNHYTLTRYQVIGSSLVRFVSHCFEESTYDTPNAGKPKQMVILSELRLLSD